MNYIELINRFWRMYEETPFNSSTTAMYFYLLHIWSQSGANSFAHSNSSIFQCVRLRGGTLHRAKKVLVKSGLIEYKAGIKGKPSIYTIKL